MFRRFAQFWAVLFMSFVLLRHVSLQTDLGFTRDNWQEVYFVIVAVTAAWLITVTQNLRPVVTLFATAAFFVIAYMEDPSGDSFFAALEAIGDRFVTVAKG